MGFQTINLPPPLTLWVSKSGHDKSRRGVLTGLFCSHPLDIRTIGAFSVNARYDVAFVIPGLPVKSDDGLLKATSIVGPCGAHGSQKHRHIMSVGEDIFVNLADQFLPI